MVLAAFVFVPLLLQLLHTLCRVYLSRSAPLLAALGSVEVVAVAPVHFFGLVRVLVVLLLVHVV